MCYPRQYAFLSGISTPADASIRRTASIAAKAGEAGVSMKLEAQLIPKMSTFCYLGCPKTNLNGTSSD
jgi:hypothetical protein